MSDDFDFEAAGRDLSAAGAAKFLEAAKAYEDGEFTDFVIVAHGIECETRVWTQGTDDIHSSMYTHIGAMEAAKAMLLDAICTEEED